MDPAEYENLARIENEHWYYRGKRRIVRYWIQQFRSSSSKELAFLDCGAGTGQFASELQSEFEVFVADDHGESLELLKKRFPETNIIPIGETGVEAGPETFDVITALDVLEHIESDQAAVNGIHSLLRPNGIFLATVPASMALWSDWDDSLHHFRRYDKKGLLKLFSENWTILHCNYTNTIPYPTVWFLRKLRRIIPQSSSTDRSEDKIQPKPLNRLLEWIFVRTGIARFRFPFGVSLIIVARKDG